MIKKKQGSQLSKHRKRSKSSVWLKLFLVALVLIVLITGSYWQIASQVPHNDQSLTPSYPQTVAGVFYSKPTIASGGTKVTVPKSFVDANKLAFVDLKLENTTSEFEYQGRSIPLSQYKNGQYLPILMISTPLQKLYVGIRVCEPCGSFSFHIVQGKYLDCDLCHTKWDIETLIGVSGGCINYPPPRLTSTVTSDVETSLLDLGLKVTT